MRFEDILFKERGIAIPSIVCVCVIFFRWLMSVSSLLVASSQLSATSMVRTPGGERHRRRADKHLGSAPAPSPYNAAPPPSHDKPVDLHNKV